MGSDLIVCRVILILLLIKSTTCESDRLDQDACQTFISSKQVKDLIEVKRRLIPSCPCLKQQIDLDYSYEKVGHCYRSWNFEDGVKMMCCYSSEGNLLTGAPHGGYMLFEDQWRNMDVVKRTCCLEDHTCQLFYEINPSDDCSSYKPPVTVTSFGDPNIETIDGNKFDFNGHGEYVFLKTSDLEIQVRLGYVIADNKDSTLFEAFTIFDNKSGETFEIHNNRSSQKLSVYRDGKLICNSTVKERMESCEKQTQKDHCTVLSDGINVAIVGCGVRFFASFITFTPGELMDVSMTPSRGSNSVNITGLAGHQEDGKFIFRKGTEVDTNSSRILFDYGESWSLVNESESLFNYSLTGGNFTFYNNHHSRPEFLEDLVGNLTELFQGYTEANISLINDTCRNYWDNRPNEECLLTIARTKQFNLGEAIMETVNNEHHIWEITHNKPPYFLGNMTDNITAVYKQDANITIDLNQYVGDDQPVDTLRFTVETNLPEKECSIDRGVFSWNVGTGLRYLDTSLTFFVIDRLNASAKHDVTINYCGCEKQSECKFNTENSNSSSEVIKKAGCQCPEYTSGLYCEVQLDACNDTKCYNNTCDMSFKRSSLSWPCAPCPKGREEQMVLKEQKCNDIDECAEGYSGRGKCEHICNNTDGSFNCSCRNGYTLNSNRYSCDDVDECKKPISLCNGQNTYCQNTLGGFECLCAVGYENSTGTCTKSEGKKYVGSMEITIVLSVNEADVKSLNKTIDTVENRNKLQSALDKGFNGTEGYQSVEVLRIMLISQHRVKREAGKGQYRLKADYVVTWAKTTIVNVTIATLFKNQPLNNKMNFSLGNQQIPIDFSSNKPEFDFKSGNKSGICSFPSQINCDLKSMKCIDGPGNYTCECTEGFESKGNHFYCADATECKDTNSDQCSGHGKCRDTYGGFTCDCDQGFSLNDTDRRNPTCNDIDECVTSQYTCHYGQCNNTIGGWDCSCNGTGFIKTNISTGFICSDIDECSNESYICKDGTCKNTVGNWSCTCEPGYRKQINSATDVTCEDAIECNETNSDQCFGHGKCRDTYGGFTCDCYQGFFLNDTDRRNPTCIDIDECETSQYTCYYGQCNNMIGGWNCSCNGTGFIKTNISTGFICSDIDECSNDSYICKDGECKNTVGDWSCTCEPGYRKQINSATNVTCEDAIECNETNSDQCSGHGKCRDTYGGFTCDCYQGFFLNDTDRRNPTCNDIDECETGQYTCYYGQCNNTKGGWDCSCNDTGFIRTNISTGFICSDIDECSNESYICTDGKCKNTIGDWSCTCEPGYKKEVYSARNVTCEDIDECDQFKKNKTSDERCVHGICENKPGSWVCTCPKNRTWQSVGNNLYAMYRCQGDYQYIGKLTLLWQASSVSNKSVETFIKKTITKLFLEYNDSIALPKEQPSMRVIFLSVDFLNATFENIAGIVVRTNASFLLHLGEAVSSEWVNEIQSQLFNQTSKFTSSGNVSVSVKEPIILNEKVINLCNIPDKSKCDLKSTVCIVQNGSLSCDCKPGFSRIDDHRCKDIDECKQEHTCLNGGTCNNNAGNWTCECPQGYTPLPFNETFINCTDIDECNQEHTCLNEGTCNNNDGNWTCECPQGYTPLPLNETFINCTDIDECNLEQDVHTCSNEGTCDNTDGNWTCKCSQGYTPLYLNETLINCTDIDECSQGHGVHFCSNNGTCVNTEGNWTCECPTGFKTLFINDTFIDCDDIDECTDTAFSCEGKKNSSSCVNTIGGWECNCSSGYKLRIESNTSRVCEDINECKTSNISCIDADKCENTIGNWNCKCGEGQKEKTINETSKVCAGEYQYVASVSFTMPDTNNHRPDNKSLVAAITNKILAMYKNTFKDSKVWVEILSIEYPTSRRKRSSQSSEQIKAKYIVHFDRSVKENELEKVDDEFVNTSIQVDNVTLTMESNGIQRESINAICDTKNNDCDTKTSTCHSTTGKIECECKEGFKKEDSGSCFAERTDSKDNVIAVASSLSGLVVILSGVIFGVLRWKRKKIKEAEKIVKRHESDLQDFNDSYLASQYMRGSRSDVGSLHDLRFSNIAIPRVKHNGDARSLNGHVPGNLYSFPQKPPKPHYKGSLPDLTNVIVYPSHNRRLSDQYPGRYFNHEKADFTRSHDAINDSGRYSPILDYRRQGAPKPDYDRFQENRFSGQKISYINGNDRPRSPKPDYGRFDGNRRSRSPNPNYRWDDRQERSNDSGVGNGYSSDSNDYRRTEQRGGYRYSDTRF